MNFVPAANIDQPHNIAVHHRRAGRPMARHAYRLSQVICYGVMTPQPFVND